MYDHIEKWYEDTFPQMPFEKYCEHLSESFERTHEAKEENEEVHTVHSDSRVACCLSIIFDKQKGGDGKQGDERYGYCC